MFDKKTIRDVDVDGKLILVRADYNVPMKNGQITEDHRIKSSLDTLQYLVERGCRVVLISHMGRPKGEVNFKYSLRPVARRLGELLGQEVDFVNNCLGNVVKSRVHMMQSSEVILLENLRFYTGEEENSQSFADDLFLSIQPDLFVQDAFGAVHRAHASIDAVTKKVPSVAGLLLEKEFLQLTQIMQNPPRPLTVFLGGAKVSDKIEVVNRFVDLADRIIVGGAMANTFLKYRGYDMGKSKLESDKNQIMDEIYQKIYQKIGKDDTDNFFVLPLDLAVSDKLGYDVERRCVKSNELSKTDMALDIGDDTIAKIHELAKDSKSYIWNGTMGVSEFPAFTKGCNEVASLMTKEGETSIVGGGDTADFVLHWQKNNPREFTHISTGGGASLELMSGNQLPGISALQGKEK